MPAETNRHRSTAVVTASKVIAAICLVGALVVGGAAVVATIDGDGSPVASDASSALSGAASSSAASAPVDEGETDAPESVTMAKAAKTLKAKKSGKSSKSGRRQGASRADRGTPTSSPSPSKQQTAAPTASATPTATPTTTPKPARTRKVKPTPAPKPTTKPAGGGGGMSATEAAVMRITNAERRKAGCSDLKASTKLTRAARAHSRDMVDTNYFSHTGRDGSSAGDRIERVGYRWRTYGENIAQGQSGAQAVMSAWMNSSGHRANILNCSFTEIGVGLSRGSSGAGAKTWTQVFGAPR